MSKVAVILSNGFEEIEGLAFYDILKRAEIECCLASINEDNMGDTISSYDE